MPAYWLTYKPLGPSSPRGWPSSEMSSLVSAFEAAPSATTALWRVTSHKTASAGDRFFLFKQGSQSRGIFGVGELLEGPRLQPDPTDIEGGETYRARIKFDHLVDPAREFLLSFEDVKDVLPESLVNSQASGVSVPADVVAELDRRLSPLQSRSVALEKYDGDEVTFDPDSVEDLRERALRAIRIRRGQPAFRAQLLDAYDRRCAISGCSVEEVLEAAHITPYLGPETHHVSNGLLLRADLHTLFDCGLLGIEPQKRTVVLAAHLHSTSYGKIEGRKLRAPRDAGLGPSKRNLEKRFAVFKVGLEHP